MLKCRDGKAPERTFLLGVGAQKGGTTWLYRYLQDHPQCNMGETKEYGAFTAAFLRDRHGQRQINRMQRLRRLLRKQERAWERGETLDPDDLLRLMEEVSFPLDLRRYAKHFCQLYDAHSEVRLVGDITPIYSALRQDEYRQIRSLLEGAGFRIKVVFLMRDPVERCYSAVRMALRAGQSHADVSTPEALNAHVLKQAQQEWCVERTCYEEIIPALEEIFPAQDLFYGFYESFISEEEVRRLTDFLELEAHPPQLSRRVNVSPRERDLSAATVTALRAFYAPTYQFCRQKFGTEQIDRLWG